MKKLIWILIVLVLVAVAIFTAVTINVNRYRPLVEQKISEALGKPVRLGALRAGWRGGLTFGTESILLPLEGWPSVELRKIDVLIKKLALSGPVDFKGTASFLSRHSNLDFNGRVVLSQSPRAAALERFHLETDLEDLDRKKVRGLGLGILKNLDLDRSLDGTFTADLTPPTIAFRLEAGRLSLDALKNPIESIGLDAVLNPDNLRVNSFAASLAGGSLKAHGEVQKRSDGLALEIEFGAENLAVEELYQGAPDRPRLTGKIFGGFSGNAHGPDSQSLMKNVSGNGRLILKEPVILNLNILRDLFKHLNKLPGMAETLSQNLPPYYRLKLSEANTTLQDIDLPFVVRDGAFYFNDMRVGTSEFLLAGQGSVTLEGNVSIQGWVVINAQLSAILANGVSEIAYFMDQAGQVQVPVSIQGPLDQLKFRPDTEYIAKKVAINKGQELLSDLLSKKKDGSSAENLFGKFL